MNINKLGKQVLSIEQMKHLEELGMDISDASAYFWMSMEDQLCFKDGRTEFVKNSADKWCLSGKENCMPTYTYLDLLEKLPDHIDFNNNEYNLFITPLYKNKDGVSKGLLIEYLDYRHDDLIETKDEIWINAVYKMLCLCIELEYIKL